LNPLAVKKEEPIDELESLTAPDEIKQSIYHHKVNKIDSEVILPITGSEKKNYFIMELEKYACYAIPCLNNLADMLTKGRKIPDPEEEEQ
jgi:hypothetical protein